MTIKKSWQMVEMVDAWEKRNRPTAERAAQLLSELLRRDAGVKISPLVLRELLAKRWETISELGHVIHAGDER